MTVLVVGKFDTKMQTAVADIIRQANVPLHVMSEDSIAFIDSDPMRSEKSVTELGTTRNVYSIPRKESLGDVVLRSGYTESAYFDRLGWSVKFSIIRPDGIIYAAVKTLPQFERCVSLFRDSLAV